MTRKGDDVYHVAREVAMAPEFGDGLGAGEQFDVTFDERGVLQP